MANKLRELLEKTPAWMRIFNRKYQIQAVVRMNDLLSERGLSQKELAERAGWSEGFVSRILSGRQNLTLKTIARFEAAIGADVFHVAGTGEKGSSRMQYIHLGSFSAGMSRPGASVFPYDYSCDCTVQRHEQSMKAAGRSRTHAERAGQDA